MTDWREELIEKMAKAIAARPQDSEDRWWIWEPEARAALAVAEPVIREQEDNALREENARLRKLLFDFEKFREIYEKAMEAK